MQHFLLRGASMLLLIAFCSSLTAQIEEKERLVRDHAAVFSTPQLTANGGYVFFHLPGSPLALSGNGLQQKSLNFWLEYGPIFSIYAPEEVQLIAEQTDVYGNHHLKFQQVVQGEKAVGAELVLHFDRLFRLKSAGGFFVLTQEQSRDLSVAVNLNVPVKPSISLPFDAVQQARLLLAKDYPGTNWQVMVNEDVLLSHDLINPFGTSIYWTQKIVLEAIGGVQSYELYFDRVSGRLIEQLQEHCDAMNRRLFNVSTNTTPIWQEGNAFPGSLNADRQNLVRTSAETYNLFQFTFGRDSYDGNGAVMNIVDNSNQVTCPNASAGSTTIHFCPGTAADDVIAHEWGHVYTNYYSNLIYAWESGAINEAYSDIFGEVVDLLNTTGTDTNDNILRTSCNQTNQRWRIGEDATAFGGHIRDMYEPGCKNDPDSKTASNYWCSSGDNGGVHTNSGVLNRSFSLLVDGGTLNGVNVTGIGLTKATHLYFQAYANYLTRVTDYHAAADALEMAGNDLLGATLLNLTITAAAPGNSTDVITAADLQQLANALLATRMRTDSNCSDDPALAQNAPAVCPAVTEDYVSIFSENWETGLTGWALTETPSNPSSWDAKPWNLETTLPDGRVGQGVKAPNPFVGDCGSDLDNGFVDLKSPVITIPNQGVNMVLTFDHYFSIEDNWDGGALFLARNGATPIHVDNSRFIFNGYSANLRPVSAGNDNPLAGLGAFTGSDNNSTSGSWGQSQVDLASAGVVPGDQIQLIWRMSHDGCNGWLGWFIDEVEVGYCINPASLPVTYRSIEATGREKDILVRWSTTDEVNNQGFYVERRSENERNFSAIGWLSSQANESSNYQLVDAEVAPATTYFYRLRQVDFDGTETLSTIVSARLVGQRISKFTIYPNPVMAETVAISWDDASTHNLKIYRSDGQLVRHYPNVTSGFTLNVTNLPTGVYWINLGGEVSKLLVH